MRGRRTCDGYFFEWWIVCVADTKLVSVSLWPPVFRLRENMGKDAEATWMRIRSPFLTVKPVCHMSSSYFSTLPGVRSLGFDDDARKRARRRPWTAGNGLFSASITESVMNQSVSLAV